MTTIEIYMAFLWIQKRGAKRYFYIRKSVRQGKKVLGKTLEYLGESPDSKTLHRALRYWRVKPKKRGRR